VSATGQVALASLTGRLTEIPAAALSATAGLLFPARGGAEEDGGDRVRTVNRQVVRAGELPRGRGGPDCACFQRVGATA
jgi:hypothetical protein